MLERAGDRVANHHRPEPKGSHVIILVAMRRATASWLCRGGATVGVGTRALQDGPTAARGKADRTRWSRYERGEEDHGEKGRVDLSNGHMRGNLTVGG